MRVVVITGSRRGWPRPDEIRELVRAADVLVVGDAAGVDAIAHHEATVFNVEANRYYADWDSFGSAAGPLRNQQMVERAKYLRDIKKAQVTCHAFPGEDSRGTWDCVTRLKIAAFDVEVHKP